MKMVNRVQKAKGLPKRTPWGTGGGCLADVDIEEECTQLSPEANTSTNGGRGAKVESRDATVTVTADTTIAAAAAAGAAASAAAAVVVVVVVVVVVAAAVAGGWWRRQSHAFIVDATEAVEMRGRFATALPRAPERKNMPEYLPNKENDHDGREEEERPRRHRPGAPGVRPTLPLCMRL